MLREESAKMVKLSKLISGIRELVEGGELSREYYNLTTRATGNASLCHESMVENGLCRKALAHVDDNRYCNILPFDPNLVPISNGYVNASFISLPSIPSHETIIIAQGPMHPQFHGPDTCGSFWRMIWEQKVGVVVMLARPDKGYTGCAKYFPSADEDQVEFGGFVIRRLGPERVAHARNPATTTAEEEEEGGKRPDDDNYAGGMWVERDLEVMVIPPVSQQQQQQVVRRLTHLEFLGWPNYGVADPAEVARLVRRVQQLTTSRANATGSSTRAPLAVPSLKEQFHSPPPSAAAAAASVGGTACPLVVHCSGGVGRSGSFVAVYHYLHSLLLQRQQQQQQQQQQRGGGGGTLSRGDPGGGVEVPAPEIRDSVLAMRSMRHPWMVEGSDQYALVYKTVHQLLLELL